MDIMAIMMKVLAVLAWCFFADILCERLVTDIALQLSEERQVETCRNDVRKEVKIWKCPVENSPGHLSESEKWNVFLNSLYCKFSTYEIQKFKKSYNVADIENFGNPDEISDNEQGIEIRKDNFQKFLDKIKQFNIKELDSVRKITIEEPQLEELNHVLNITIKQGFNINCKEPYMFIEGDYIVMSHVNKSIETGVVEGNCKALLETDKLKFLNIFALNTVFIDDDMTTIGALKNMTIISPKWQIINTRMIDLRGKSGEPLSTRNAQFKGIDGADGRPGTPGGPGGNFFGIGEKFFKGENLQIFVSGGNGGPGEDGVNGTDGKNGEGPSWPPSTVLCARDICDKKINGFPCKRQFECSSSRDRRSCFIEIYGHDGTKGGNGGNGGKGGIGGYPGEIDLIDLSNSSKIVQFHTSGQSGINGRAGIGGKGGITGTGLSLRCFKRNYYGEYGEWHWSQGYQPSKKRASSGENGSEGANYKDIHAPKKANAMSENDKARIINQYKIYLRKNLNDPFKYSFLMKFLEDLESNDEVKSVYGTVGLADELHGLEEHFNMLIKNIDLRPFYQSLLNRISEYAQNFAKDVNASQYKLVLAYLYTTTLSRLYNLEDDIESNLVIHVSQYLDSVKQDILKLKDLHDAKTKKELISKYKHEYKKEIDAKIKEATNIITNDIIPEIDKIANETNVHIETLLDEVIKLQNEAKNNITELKNKRQQLALSLQLQSFVSGLQIFGSVLGFLGPYGEAAGSVIEIGSTLTETFIYPTTATAPPGQTVTDLKSLTKQIQKIEVKRLNDLKKSLHIISEEAKKYPEAFSDISAKVSNFSKRLSGEKINSDSLQEAENIEIALKAILHEKGKELSTTHQNNDKKINEAFQNMKQAIQLSSRILDTYDEHISNPGKRNAIDQAIQESEQKLHTLKKFEDAIYNTIMPMLQSIQIAVESILTNIDTKSKVVLDVAKWKVKGTLKKILTQISQLTANFEVHGQIIESIEKMKEAIVTLIDVQEHIQDYQKEQTFANFFTDVNSAAVSNTDMFNTEHEPELKQILNDLEITLTSSIIVQRYKVAFGALKQFVFPFANTYLKSLVLPTHLKLNPDKGEVTLSNLTKTAITQIDKIQSKLNEYNQTVSEHDYCLVSGSFDRKHKSTRPFFVWESTKHKEMISKLLSGENVTFNADITQSARYDAIKFNTINFNFTSNDNRTQSEIKEALKEFGITATHLGNNYYRYNNEIYLMPTSVRRFSFHLETDKKGLPVRRSRSYDKLKGGDLLLSPYATWELKLFNVTDILFEVFNEYKDKINLELIGDGQYVIRDSFCEEPNVDKYYTAVGKCVNTN